MFERFTDEARGVVTRAQEESRQLGASRIGTEHVLIALAGDGAAGAVMRRAGLDRETVRRAVADVTARRYDADALASIGIDLGQVRQRVEATFGAGALDHGLPGRRGRVPFTKGAKQVLEQSLRDALARGDDFIGSQHVLGGLLRALEPDEPAALALERAGVPPRRLRELLDPPGSA